MAQCTPWQSPGHSNPNLLKNWDFRQPVNQHGQTEYTTQNLEIYTIDAWKIGWLETLTVKDGYITFTGNEGCYIRTIFEDGYITNQPYTFSLADETSAIYSVSFTGNLDDIHVGKHLISKNVKQLIIKNTGNIQAVKLEVGTVSTLAIDLLQPPNYAAQLRECQRYLQVYDVPLIASAQNEWNICVPFKLNQEMRITPTFRYEGDIVFGDNVDSTIISSFEMFSGNTTMPVLRFTSNTGSLVKGHSYYIENLKLIFSAEL